MSERDTLSTTECWRCGRTVAHLPLHLDACVGECECAKPTIERTATEPSTGRGAQVCTCGGFVGYADER